MTSRIFIDRWPGDPESTSLELPPILPQDEGHEVLIQPYELSFSRSCAILVSDGYD
jgi:hypothetical protein